MDLLDKYVMSISAPRRSGKSFLIKHLLKKTMKTYDFVVIMCPSLDFNDDYDDFRKNKKFFFISDPSNALVDELWNRQESAARIVMENERKKHRKMRCPKTMVIFDDCVDSGVISWRGKVDKYAERGRHINMNVIIASQKMSAISRSVRINSDYFIIFSPFAVQEFEKYVEDFLPKSTRNEMRDKILKIFEVPYQFVMLDNGEKQLNKKFKTSNAQDFIKGKIETIPISMRKNEESGKRSRDDEAAAESKKKQRKY